MGRATEFDQAIADVICDRLTNGESLRSIALDDAMPAASTVYKWLSQNEQFADQYAHAREAQADTLADEIVDIADDGSNDWMERELESGKTIEVVNAEHIARSRLRVDARKWVAAKLKPKKYGDRQLIGSDPDNPLPPGFSVNLHKATDA
jgi:hypothetical protein